LDLIDKAPNEDELLQAILHEYEVRLEEIAGSDLKELHQQEEVDFRKQKLLSLEMFAKQAISLKEKAQLYYQLNQKNQELSDKNKELKQKNEHYLNMLSFISHELRSPLISILGYGELLADGTLGKINNDQRNALGVIVRVAKTLIEMIKNYLNLAKIETGQITLKKTKVNIKDDIFETVLLELKEQLDSNSMRVVSDTSLNVELNVDKALLEIVVKNLFSNALRYGKNGTEIMYSFVEQKDCYLFTIKNSGTGVPESKLKMIFEKFVQTHDIPQPATYRGSGLGLFIAKIIIEEHRGSIWAESEYGVWFRVNFTLPKN
jgi:signal transduction histidine kinase